MKSTRTNLDLDNSISSFHCVISSMNRTMIDRSFVCLLIVNKKKIERVACYGLQSVLMRSKKEFCFNDQAGCYYSFNGKEE